MILSSKNKLVKKITSLKQKKYRDESNLFCIEGIRLAEESLLSNWPVKMCVYTKTALEKDRVAAFLERLPSIGGDGQTDRIPLIEVSEEVYNKITDTKEPQGIMVILGKNPCNLNELFTAGNRNKKKMPLIAVLDGVGDPGNAGTIIRTADAAGCTGVVLLKDSADLFSGKTLRATMGSLFHIPVAEEVERGQLIAALEKHGVSLLAATLEDKSHIYYQHNFRKPLAIAFGNEGGGLSREILSCADGKIHIPINGRAESLNVAVAAGIILYEAARQQGDVAE